MADGSVVQWNPAQALPRLSESPWLYVRGREGSSSVTIGRDEA